MVLDGYLPSIHIFKCKRALSHSIILTESAKLLYIDNMGLSLKLVTS